jgi:tetratricopeptide (TPR) repeat protein
VAIAAAWWFTRPEPAPPAPPAPPTAEVPAPPKADVGKELRDKVQGEIEAQLRNGPAVPVTTEPDAHELIPINRAVPSAGTAVPPSGTPMPVPTAKVATSTANDHLAVGDEAALGRDWRTAAAAYGKAAALKPTDSALQLKLGEALLNVGDSGNAQRALLAAANGRQARAWKLLGDLATRDGDAAGANGYYAKYLATNPPDAAAIRSRMGGG